VEWRMLRQSVIDESVSMRSLTVVDFRAPVRFVSPPACGCHVIMPEIALFYYGFSRLAALPGDFHG
jgi:hypothetical protein